MISPRLIATHGLGGGPRMVALMGIMPMPQARAAFPPVAYGRPDIARYRVDEDTFDIPVSIGPEDDEEAVVLTLLMEIAIHVV